MSSQKSGSMFKTKDTYNTVSLGDLPIYYDGTDFCLIDSNSNRYTINRDGTITLSDGTSAQGFLTTADGISHTIVNEITQELKKLVDKYTEVTNITWNTIYDTAVKGGRRIRRSRKLKIQRNKSRK